MSVTISTPSTGKQKRSAAGPSVVQIAGLTARTGYNVVVTDPDGQSQTYPITSDGSGNASVKLNLQKAGSHEVAVFSLPTQGSLQASTTIVSD